MPCLLALIVLSILGIFSASHRKLAREAFDCVFRRVTLRPCNTGFDTKVKAAILGKLLNRSPKVAQFVSHYFEVLSWILVIGLTVSSLWSLRSVYNFWAWGDCNGPHSGGFCAFDPTGQNNKVSATQEGSCVDSKLAAKALKLKPLTLTDYPTLTINNKSNISGMIQKQLVFIGCFNCDYTRKAWPMIKDLMTHTSFTLTFIHFPTKPETKYLMAYDYVVFKDYPQKYWQWVDQLFADTKEQNASEQHIQQVMTTLGMNAASVSAQIKLPATIAAVDTRYADIQKTGLYGTPTVFINGTAVVGPKPERVYGRLLRGTWF